MPTPIPELAELMRRLNIKSPVDPNTEPQLQHCLDVATAWVNERVYKSQQVDGERAWTTVEAILLLASRLYARRNTPEGVMGWPELGVTRVVGEDPDIQMLLSRQLDWSNAGVA